MTTIKIISWNLRSVGAAFLFLLTLPHAWAETPIITYAGQGWSDADRRTFYTTSQGSQIMPVIWFKALRRLPYRPDRIPEGRRRLCASH
jgi:hypothetical protein